MNDFEAIRARAEKATRGPWETSTTSRDPGARMVDIPDGDDVMSLAWELGGGLVGMSPANADFVAHAREDIPALLAMRDAVLAMHPARKVVPDVTRYIVGCPTCRTDGPCETRKALGG